MAEKLRRTVIKEELVMLTGDFTKAILLNQFIYWSEKVKDFDKFIGEEKKRMELEGQNINIEKQNGWIYKTAEELSEETMLGLTPKTMRRHMKELIDNGWLDERNNPKYSWDRTKQYRVDIAKIQKDLQNIGYVLEGYALQMQGEEKKNAIGKKEKCIGQKGKIKEEEKKNRTRKKEKAIPEITTEITTKINKEYIESSANNISSSRKNTTKIPYKEIVQAYNDICISLPDVKVVSDKRKRILKSIFNKVKEIQKFKEVFKKAEDSDFLSGRNGKWNGCNFDWLINFNNFIKVIEGTYDNRIEQGKYKNNSKTRAYNSNEQVKTKFHNFESRTSKYSAKQLEDMVRYRPERQKQGG